MWGRTSWHSQAFGGWPFLLNPSLKPFVLSGLVGGLGALQVNLAVLANSSLTGIRFLFGTRDRRFRFHFSPRGNLGVSPTLKILGGHQFW